MAKFPSDFFVRSTFGGPFDFEKFRAECSRLTPEHLEAFAANQIIGSLRAYEVVDIPYVHFAVSVLVLQYFLGQKWVTTAIYRGGTSKLAPIRQFLNLEMTGPFYGDWRYIRRIGSVADWLYNSQDITGFRDRIKITSPVDLESAFGELQCAMLFAHPSLKPRFIIPSGVKGKDYDAELSTPSNQIICCEIKTKLECHEYSSNSVFNTLESARKQLPKSNSSMVFLKIPEDWTYQPDTNKLVDESVQRVFRQSHRMVAVIIVWEQNTNYGEVVETSYQFRVVHNRRSANYSDDITRTINQFRIPSTWDSIQDIVMRRLPCIWSFMRRNLFTEIVMPDQHPGWLEFGDSIR